MNLFEISLKSNLCLYHIHEIILIISNEHSILTNLVVLNLNIHNNDYQKILNPFPQFRSGGGRANGNGSDFFVETAPVCVD